MIIVAKEKIKESYLSRVSPTYIYPDAFSVSKASPRLCLQSSGPGCGTVTRVLSRGTAIQGCGPYTTGESSYRRTPPNYVHGQLGSGNGSHRGAVPPTPQTIALTTRKLVRQLGVRIRIKWVPSHKGIEGNEKADQIAKEAAT